ncbi:MAG: hypothetical protein KC546_15405 [Anaerolineae bacterium]|nr:hypothetical protein [Anaerolineae bacterium]MCA9895424.1 hypothetical protein [Anaerolineae bacterium]
MVKRNLIRNRTLLILLIFAFAEVVMAQQTLAVQLIVTFPDVEVQRAGTEQWISLARDSVSAIGSGDSVRTGEFGRAFIQHGDGFTVMLLPQSRYWLNDFGVNADGTYRLDGEVDGVTIQRLAPEMSISEFVLHSLDLSVIEPAALFGVWSRRGQPDVITVAEGSARINFNDFEFDVAAGQGFFADNMADIMQMSATAIDSPYSAARVEAALYGCPGHVLITTDVDDLRVRSGPGTNYFAVGLVPDGLPISVMNVNQRGDWVRIQFRSYFGWVFRNAIEDDCGTVSVLPDTAPVEPIRQFVDVTPAEEPFLTPFFLSQSEDRYRYQYEG